MLLFGKKKFNTANFKFFNEIMSCESDSFNF